MPTYLQPDSQTETDRHCDVFRLHTVWEGCFCELHVCFVLALRTSFVESFTHILFSFYDTLSYHIIFSQVDTQTTAGHALALSQRTHLTPNTQQAN